MQYLTIITLPLFNEWVVWFEQRSGSPCVNICPVEPFETVMVIKGYTNKIDLN